MILSTPREVPSVGKRQYAFCYTVPDVPFARCCSGRHNKARLALLSLQSVRFALFCK